MTSYLSTSKVSAALFKSRIPSGACLSKLMNFFVNSPANSLIINNITVSGTLITSYWFLQLC